MNKQRFLKWLLCVTLTLALAVSLLAATALADTEGDWEYEVVDGKATVTGYSGSATELIIPSTLGGYPVTSIRDYTFDSCNSIISVTIPNGVTSIGEGAFINCTGLTSAEIPETVTIIGERVFEECRSLSRITIPAGVNSIENYSFSGCRRLTRVTIPDGVTSIGDGAFSNCGSLTQVTIPDGVTSIEDYTFYYCIGLSSVTIGNGVTNIGEGAFGSCESLTSITIPSSVTSIGERAFEQCSSLTSATIPDSVTNIGSQAFCGCSNLTSVTIPDSVTSIGDSAFSGCSGLTSVKIGNGVTSIESYAFYNCSCLESVTIPDSVLSIGLWAFSNCNSLTSVKIGSGVTSIGEEAFGACTSLTCVSIPSSVKSIGSSAFEGCSSLKAAAIPEGITDVVTKTFSGCTAMTDIVLPQSLEYVAANAFSDCTGLAYIHYPGTAADWAEVEIESGNDALSRASLSGVLSVRYTTKTVNTGGSFCFTPVNNIGDCTWRTGNEAIATVTANGTVTGVTVGNTYLYCTDSTGAEAKCLLKIVLGPLSIRYGEKSIRMGESFQFAATGGTGIYTWRVGNTAKATVDITGMVTGVSEGNTYLYCRDSAGNEVKCLLKVLSPNLSIHQTEKTLAVGESFQFAATGGSGTYTWRTGNASVATVDATGKVTGKTAGNTYLYCTDTAGEEVSCRLTILAPLSIRYSSKSITAGGSFQFTATGGSGDYTWHVGNTATATVNSSGKVSGVAAGQNTYLYCTDSDGREVRCLLKIVSPPSFCFELQVGDSFRFGAAEGSGGYTWRVGNASVASVDANGNVTGVSAGNTYLYCKDSSGVEIKCLLKIKA